jgi:transient receptor potential cation channel subfamily M protein 3
MFEAQQCQQKAQYVRLAYDTSPRLIMQLFTKVWGLELPKLVITVQGGKRNFELGPKFQKVLRRSLLNVAEATEAWIITDGSNTGVTREIGNAVLLDNTESSSQVICIGITSWGVVERKYPLRKNNLNISYHSIPTNSPVRAVLNSRLSCFLLADDGTSGKYGAEFVLRRKLEEHISREKLCQASKRSTPVVCFMIEGDLHTITAVHGYVTAVPHIPVVVFDGSGRAADLLASVLDCEVNHLKTAKDYYISLIKLTFGVDQKEAEHCYSLLLQCNERKDLFTVFHITNQEKEMSLELNEAILMSVLKSQHLSAAEHLSFVVTWNRVDIAVSYIRLHRKELSADDLEDIMMQALKYDRVDFVKILLENGVKMNKVLSVSRLEELYNAKQGPSNALGYVVKDIRPKDQQGSPYTLYDIGLVINRLMGGAYRSYYKKSKFQSTNVEVMGKAVDVHGSHVHGVAETSFISGKEAGLDHPYSDLFVWAVLTKRQQMALLLWQFGEDGLAKSLVACNLYRAMALETADDDLKAQIYEDLRNYAKEFENIALDLLDVCYKQCVDRTKQLLTCELQNWSKQTCMNLAATANHMTLLGHPCSQMVLADIWKGGLRTRKNNNFKVILGLICPFYIPKLEYVFKEELHLIPQTEEEHLICLEEKNESKKGKPAGNGHNSDADVEADFSNENSFTRDTEVKSEQPLNLREKLREFFTAPITKFWEHSIAYIVFLLTFTYTVLVQMEDQHSWQELYATIYICAFACEAIQEFITLEAVSLRNKLSVWAQNRWNISDAVAIILSSVGLFMRFHPPSIIVVRLIFCIDIIYWYIRILNILAVNQYFGPLITMMGKMLKDTIYFVLILLVVLLSYASCHRAVLHAEIDLSWAFVREMIFKPYFMLYGEVFPDHVFPSCDENTSLVDCHVGPWVTAVQTVVYLFVANILLINLLIAVHNYTFDVLIVVSHEIWMFHLFRVVMEYEKKPALPPPFSLLCHVYSVLKYCYRKLRGFRKPYDNALKIFLDHDTLVDLKYFEEECMDRCFEELEGGSQRTVNEFLRNIDYIADEL